jgi:AcrR family transcriptional regulator
MSKQVVANKGGRGARQRILDTAAELFYRDGINATGVERLAAESSVSKRTLYQHFPSKTAVVEEYLRAIEQRASRLSTGTDDQTPRQRLLAVFDTPTGPTPTLRGCPRKASPTHSRSWPGRPAPRTRDNWAISSRCCRKVLPRWQLRSTIQHRGHGLRPRPRR